MHAIWKGAISFGLVSIPVSVYPAVRKGELKLRLLRKSDLSPINYKRIAEADGKEVPYPETVRGYEYERGAFVPLEEEDLKAARATGVQTIQILDFVALKEIDPIFFDKPYYLEPDKSGARAYALLRDAMVESGTIGIAKVVIRSKQHLAALKPKGQLLLLELMHFADELVDTAGFKAPAEAKGNPKEMELAKALIGSMVTDWQPDKYQDDYQSALMEIIERKVKAGEKDTGKRPAPQRAPSNIVNVMEMLEKSLQKAGGKSGKRKPKRQREAA